ncbi:MAG: SCO family protein [bacterium]|nr:SCO family protein [bacterium]
MSQVSLGEVAAGRPRKGLVGLVNGFSDLLVGGRFGAFALALLVLYEGALLALLWLPGADTGLGAFAEEFRVWCYGYNQVTGQADYGYVSALLAGPLVLSAAVALVWGSALRELFATPRAFVGPIASAAVTVVCVVGSFVMLGIEPTGASSAPIAFPAESLRTQLNPPEIHLQNQLGQVVDLAELRGKVVLVTAIYASCPHTCPLILAQTKRAIAALPPDTPLEDLRVIGVTMDPERDTVAALAEFAELQELALPTYQFATGEPDVVEGTLDRMGISRRRDPETGIIEHANLFLLVDRSGKLAYRFTLGDRQERWLVEAVGLLLGESAAAS